MKLEQLQDEIRDTNLAYLMLAQQMIRRDRADALYRLGISDAVADLLEGLTAAQILKVAAANLLMCRFRFDDEMVWSLLASHGQNRQVGAGMHASILMAGKLDEQLAGAL